MKPLGLSLFIMALFTFSFPVNGQSFKGIVVSPADNGKVLSAFLQEQEDRLSIDFIYNAREMRALTLTGIEERQRFIDYFGRYFNTFRGFEYSDAVVFIVNKRAEETFSLKKENFLLLTKQEDGRGTLTGRVSDALSGEPLIGAQVSVADTPTVTAADIDGKFEIGIPLRDMVLIDVAYVGYEPNRYVIGFSSGGNQGQLQAALLPESRELQSVTITAERMDENVSSNVTGVEQLNVEAIKTMPALLGEVDPIRSLATLPGVSTVGDLASGFNVRGGASGQNLLLQDGATVYNPSHLFGFFSAFNPDMISNVTLYKGGGPANFGSRISAVVDVSLRNGDAAKHRVAGGVGLISSRLSLEGPIVRDKSSYLLGGRIAYPNWLVKATDNIALKNSAAGFYDVTGKIFHTLNKNNYVSVTGYHSHDDFQLATDSVFSWTTTNVSLTWDHTFNENSFSRLTLVNSNYNSEVQSMNEIQGFRYYNSIRNGSAKFEFTKQPSVATKFTGGIASTGTWLEPGKLIPADQFDNVAPEDMQDQRSLESALYIQADLELSKTWSVSAGLRYGHFLRLGKENIYIFNDDVLNGRYPAIEDTLSYSSMTVIRTYSGLEPRISLRYLIDGKSSVKASYYRGYQYLHLISNTTSTTPQDYWVSSGPHLEPQRGDQYSLGFFRNMKDNRYELSAEGFYKHINGAVDYIEGADITLNPVLEAGLSQGTGVAYGAELLIKKNAGRLNGWVAYTYSRSLRKFAGDNNNERINNGEYYPASFDQPHHLSIIGNYQVGSRSVLSANFTYSTGRPITIPVSKFSYDVYLSVLNYSARNEYRIPDYHRLDLSLTIKDKPRNNKRFSNEWVISLVNVYGRKNAYAVSFDRYGNATKRAVLGTVLPSISYNFRF